MESLKLTREQIPLFLRAIAHNRRVVLEQIESGRFCSSDYYFVIEQDGIYTLLPPGKRDAELARSFNDYFAGSLIGALPFAARHGSDGIQVSPTGVITPVELKLCMKSEDRYTINEKGYLTVVGSKRVVGFRSDGSACYEIGNNLASKNVDTYFVVYDGIKHELIAIYKMKGNDIISRLGKVAPKDSEKAKKISITLAAFMESGEEIFLDFLDSVGVEAWEKRIYDREGRDPSETVVWSPERNELFFKMWETGESLENLMTTFPGRTKAAIQSHAKILGAKRPRINN